MLRVECLRRVFFRLGVDEFVPPDVAVVVPRDFASRPPDDQYARLGLA